MIQYPAAGTSIGEQGGRGSRMPLDWTCPDWHSLRNPTKSHETVRQSLVDTCVVRGNVARGFPDLCFLVRSNGSSARSVTEVG
jgi:hypothetical protein